MLRLNERNLKYLILDLRNTSGYAFNGYSSVSHIKECTIDSSVTWLRFRNDFINNINGYLWALLYCVPVHRGDYLRFMGTTLPDTRIDDVGCNLNQLSGGKVSNRGWLMI